MRVAVERSEVQWGTTRIAYAIRRSERRRTVAVTVAPPGQVVLTAPKATSIARLDEVVHSKARWIRERLRLVRPSGPIPGAREFVSGETFLYLGRQYRLEVRASGTVTEVRLAHGRLIVTVPSASRGIERAEAVRTALVAWYRQHALARLAERAAWWSRKLRVSEPKVLVREQELRWGSCAPGVVRFNWRIIQASMDLVDYVVCHELVHLLHQGHGRAFWATLGRALPNYASRRIELRTTGTFLVW